MSQSDRVTDLIMHYYLEHGRNRDLEKYLRLRRMSNATRSSSDGSLPGLDELQRKVAGGGCAASNRSGLGKSMENLATLRKQAEQQDLVEGEKSLRNASTESAKSLANKSSEQPDKVGAVSDVKGVTVKEKKVEQKSGRNFNFNLESVIEINLPPPPAITMTPAAGTIAPITYIQPALPFQTISAGKEQLERIVVHENSTQTPGTEDDPIRPIVKTQGPGTGEETLDSLKDLSPVSSVASNKQRLEWDSLGDIGYDSSERLQLCGAADLNETEKRCLQRYFARKGLNFDRSVIVVRQREEKDKKLRPEDGSIVLVNPGAQSTPKPTVLPKPQRDREAAKSTQTSLHARETESRGTQASECSTESERVEHHAPHREDKAVGTVESYTIASVDAAESFEFFPPSVPETGNNTPSAAASVSTPVQSSSTTSSSGGNNTETGGISNCPQRPTFDDEVKLGLTLYNSICEVKNMPTGVKESLIDKIFRKLSRHDPKRRTREQLLHDYAAAVRKRNEKGTSQEENVYDDVSPSGEKDDRSMGSVQQDRSLGAEVVLVEETKYPKATVESGNVSYGSVKGASSESNEAKNVCQVSSAREHSSIESSSHPTGSSPVESIGTTKENAPGKLSAPEARDRRVRKAMQDYLKPMTHSEVEYENFRDLRQRTQQSANEPQLAQIDRAIEQLLVKKMLLLNAGQPIIDRSVAPSVKQPSQPEPTPNSLPSERSGTSVYTSVHEPPSLNSVSKESSSAWNSHYHMAKAIKTRSKLETPTADTSSPPSDVSIPTFIKQKKEKFVENYDQLRKRRAFEEQNHIYTRPYSSSGQRNADKRRQQEKENYTFGKDKFVMNKLSKGTATDRRAPSSSNGSILSPEFISSDSISIPVVTTLTNTTTTHHYDIKSRRPSPPIMLGRAAGTQTTDSILRTKPIFGETKPKATSATASVQVSSTMEMMHPDRSHSLVRCHCHCGQVQQQAARAYREVLQENGPVRRRTEIIDGTGGGRQDKQAQTKPSSIAYVITFEGDKERKVSVPSPPPPRSSSVSSIESEPENGKDKDSEKMLTLREQFRRSCPATLTKIEQRRECINELNKLRNKRNQQRQRLLLLTSDDSLRKTNSVGRGKLPPHPLSQRRVFASTRAMRESTRQRVRNLPEVQKKKEIERFNNIKRKNLILKDVYNKNLQRKVLRGQVDLSNSVRVIQD